jgi:Tetratricopeptide repeat
MNERARERSVQGNCEAQERLLATRRAALGEDHPETLTAMLELADCLWAQGRLIAAGKLEEQVVEGRRQLLGEQHADTLKAIGKLAVTLAAQGNLADARLLQEQVVDGRRSLFGDADVETLRAINNLAGTVASQGDLDAARELLESVVATACRELGEQHAIASLRWAIWPPSCGSREREPRLTRCNNGSSKCSGACMARMMKLPMPQPGSWK